MDDYRYQFRMGGKLSWNVMFAYFPYRQQMHPSVCDFLLRCQGWAHQMKAEGKVGEIHFWHDDVTPINVGRNRAAKYALENEVDILVMVDNDMGPDLVDQDHAFVPEAFQFTTERWELSPTVVVAPACTAPPDERPVVGRWRTLAKGSEIALDLYTREEAAAKTGIQPEAVAGMGLCMIDMRVFRGFDAKDPQTGKISRVALRPPWFYWEWDDDFQTGFITGEDTSFTRDVAALGARWGLDILHVAWDCWAVHYKIKPIGKPSLIDWRSLRVLFGDERELRLGEGRGVEHRTDVLSPDEHGNGTDYRSDAIADTDRGIPGDALAASRLP